MLIPFAEQGRQNVLAYLIAPDVIATVAARVRRRDQIHPVVARASAHPVAALADAFRHQAEAALQAIGIDRIGTIKRDERRYPPTPNR